ncbi:Uncharacterized protein (Fragment) OS=uncultured bacterium PE=4 SV=1 [Gemmata massiliana]|uniref:SMI1/KNR4 family protein n=1 Tax=Gemmata massiliana TaxID=1210884 RepID=A0A6P2D2Y3_9BACT
MNEAEWLTRKDLREMAAFIRWRGSERKRRLFLVACARAIWDRVPLGDMRRAVEISERFADGEVPVHEFYAANALLYATQNPPLVQREWWESGSAEKRSVYSHCLMTTFGSQVLAKITEYPWHETRLLTEYLQPHLLREVFGNPFRAVACAPEWSTDTVLALARGMYESRDFSAMPILADALQDAGCDSADVLDHCRDAAGPHVRGCWVVDLVLGKE